MSTALSTAQSIALLVEYNGTSFSGSQSQGLYTNVPTIQQTIMQAFQALGLADVVFSSHFASRTDAGVHARGQILQVRCDKQAIAKKVKDLCSALNAKLPSTISIRAIEWELPETFNVQHTAKYRWYRYEWFLSKYRSVFTPFNAVREHRLVCVSAMQQAAQSLVGSHHFETFQSPSVYSPSALCTVVKAAITQPTVHTVWFDIIANRFVYKMVRNIAAALWQIGLNPEQHPPHSLFNSLNQRNRAASPKTAPSNGLTLMSIAYEPNTVNTTQPPSLSTPLFCTDSLTQLLNKTLTKEFSYDENIFCQA